MLIDFTVENYRSIREPQTLSLMATSAKELDQNVFLLEREPKIRLLKSAVIYGANASGKSNLLRAMGTMLAYIHNATNLKVGDPIPYYDPFRLDPAYAEKPTRFEMEFVVEAVRYRYFVSFRRNKVEEEGLYFYPKKVESCLFHRKNGKPIVFGDYLKGPQRVIENQLIDNTLFLSKAANSKNEMVEFIYRHITENFIIDMNTASGKYFYLTVSTSQLLGNRKNTFYNEFVQKLLQTADSSLEKFEIRKKKTSSYQLELPKDIPEDFNQFINDLFSYKITTSHKISHSYGDDVVSFNLADESDGTQKTFELAGMLLLSITRGATLIIDELNNSLHPIITRFIIEMYCNKKTNPNNAQLIFATHDVTLLDSKQFRRDQIWFTEKDNNGQTNLFSLSEFDSKEVRKDTPFGRWYLSGRFGAVPIVNDIDLNVRDFAHAKEEEDK